MRYQIRHGAKLIKVSASGGVMSHSTAPGAQQYSDEEFAAIADEAHRAGHDWYDSLVAFTRIFCTGGKRRFAAWQTHQSRSYFAIKLPHGWWLIGTDVQLESDIDDPQLEYFSKIADSMAPDDRVILCSAEPDWIYEQRYRQFDSDSLGANLAFRQERIFGNRVDRCTSPATSTTIAGTATPPASTRSPPAAGARSSSRRTSTSTRCRS